MLLCCDVAVESGVAALNSFAFFLFSLLRLILPSSLSNLILLPSHLRLVSVSSRSLPLPHFVSSFHSHSLTF
nr:MAG TPA: hypothetical protein [Caudoviricetes sp.]